MAKCIKSHKIIWIKISEISELSELSELSEIGGLEFLKFEIRMEEWKNGINAIGCDGVISEISILANFIL